jgi:predicted secreted hydrolase
MEAPTLGFQLSFFRHRTGLGADSRSRFAPRQLLFAHAAVTDLHQGRHRHAQRIARWSGDPAAQPAAAALDDARLQIGRWRLARSGDAWQAQAHLPALGSTQGPTQGPTQEPAQGPAHELALDLRLRATQPLLLQGDAGWSRKGPDPAQASHYYSLPQFALQADTAGRFASGHDPGGRAWLDHEWSDELLHPEAVGWDWAGINLADGAALTVFRLRLRDGSVLWAGGSWRPAAGTTQAFRPQEVDMQPRRHWSSTGTGGRYPVEWSLRTPAGEHHLRALLDAQELDARASTGNVYWEGLSELLDVQGRRVGLGYLELTGYAAPLRL